MFFAAKLDKILAFQYDLGYFRATDIKESTMGTLLAFAGSNSSTSINFKLVKYTVSKIEGHDIQLLNMANFPFPMYSADYEREKGYSNALIELKNDIQKASGVIISVNEHNSNPSAYFKNLIDWLSRVERKFLADKKVFLMATSGGRRGAMGSLETIEKLLPRFGGEAVETFSLPIFHENFDESKGIVDDELAKEHSEKLNSFLAKI